MWDKLHSVFEKKNENSLLLLHQKFFTFAKEHDENIVSYISRLEDLVQRLSDLGEVVSDAMIITKIIMSLPPEYNSFSSAWELAAKAKVGQSTSEIDGRRGPHDIQRCYRNNRSADGKK